MKYYDSDLQKLQQEVMEKERVEVNLKIFGRRNLNWRERLLSWRKRNGKSRKTWTS